MQGRARGARETRRKVFPHEPAWACGDLSGPCLAPGLQRGAPPWPSPGPPADILLGSGPGAEPGRSSSSRPAGSGGQCRRPGHPMTHNRGPFPFWRDSPVCKEESVSTGEHRAFTPQPGLWESSWRSHSHHREGTSGQTPALRPAGLTADSRSQGPPVKPYSTLIVSSSFIPEDPLSRN